MRRLLFGVFGRMALPLLVAMQVGCGTPPVAPSSAPATRVPAEVVAQPEEPPPKIDETSPEMRAAIDKTMAELSKVRGLVVKRKVSGKILGRDAVIKLIMAKAQRELPKGVLEAQGHLLRGLGLIDADYDFVEGIYGMLRNNVAGFYEQHGEMMYLLDDLEQAAMTETLVHELEHAMQDQHFDLKKMLKYRPGDTDRVTAAHALMEGDAMSAMFDVSMGNAFAISERMLRVMMVTSVAMMEGGTDTPRVLQAALVAPYIDGFAFVQKLRERGGWDQVNDAMRDLPISTEQLLHLDKFDAREPPLIVREPPLPDPDYKKMDADVLGEQGTRMSFEQWGTTRAARRAAAGWGGDRYIVARKEDMVAVAWHIVFDNEDEAKEAATLLRGRLALCKERTDLGPLAWKRNGAAIAIAGGPFYDGPSKVSAADCSSTVAWLNSILGT